MLKVIKFINSWNNEDETLVFGTTEELKNLIDKCNYHSVVAPLFLDELPKFSSRKERRYIVKFEKNELYSVLRLEEDDNKTIGEQIKRFYSDYSDEITNSSEYEFSSSEELLNFFFGGRIITEEDMKEDPYWATLIDFPNEEEEKISEGAIKIMDDYFKSIW